MYKKKTFYFSSLLGGFLSGGFCPRGGFVPILILKTKLHFQQELPIQHSLTNIIFYPAISTFAVQICYTNKFLLYSY